MFEGKQNTRKENVAVCSVAAAKVSRGAAKLQRRLLRAGLYQWKRRVDHHGYLRELSDRITQGRQRRLLQQAWDRYTGFLEYCQQHCIHLRIYDSIFHIDIVSLNICIHNRYQHCEHFYVIHRVYNRVYNLIIDGIVVFVHHSNVDLVYHSKYHCIDISINNNVFNCNNNCFQYCIIHNLINCIYHGFHY